MSSLLDILHRKDSRAGPEAGPWPVADSGAPPVELHLAIDNGPPATGREVPATGAGEPPDAPAIASPEPEPAPSATGATADATLLIARQQQGRSRRSTFWLSMGLALIVIGAGMATWLLGEPAETDSLFTTPPDAEAPVAAPAPGLVERPAGTPAPAAPVTGPAPAYQAPSAVPADARQPVSADETDTAWFDAPATDELTPGAAASNVESIRIVRGTTTNPLFSKLADAWTAFQAADYARAEALWREVRAAEPGNVDALLGLGALAARGGRATEAQELYQAVLLAEPKNATAIGALSTLPAAGAQKLDESTLKNALRDQPGAAGLHFALGLQYVAQGRWPDAQMAFFDAVRNEPANADYAYNLAVSLDQLGQPGPAAAYYQRAVELATASSLFDSAAAAARLATLRATTP